MDILAQRDNQDSVLERKFLQRVFKDAADDIDKAQRKYLTSRGFENAEWYNARAFVITDNELEYSHLKKHRFVDMKIRHTKNGIVRKKQHPIHNKIIWGHYNNIIKELHFGFTEEVKQQLRTIG